MNTKRVRRLLRTGLTLVLLGCGDGDDRQEDHAAGSRLTAVWWKAPTGEALFGGWYDEVLGTECEMVAAADGTATCLPAPTDVPWVRDVLYLDDRCTKPATTEIPRRQAKALTFLVASSADGCWEKPRLYRAGKPAPSPTLYERDGGTCRAHDGGLSDPAARVVTQLEEITDEAARAQVKVGPASRGIARRWFEGPDGSRGPLGFWDEARRAPCVFVSRRWDGAELPLLQSEGTWRCVPLRDPRYWEFPGGPADYTADPAGSAVAAGDPACQRLAVKWRAEPTCPSKNGVVWEWNPESRLDVTARPTATCPSALTVHALGDRLDRIYPWRTCLGDRTDERPSPPAAGLEIRALAPVPPATLPDGRFVVAPTAGRLRRRWIETAAGRAPAGLWDTKLGAACTPGKNAQGASVCLPLGAGTLHETEFTEATCSRKRASLPERATCGGPPLAVSQTDSGPDDLRHRVYHVERVADGAPHSRQTLPYPCRADARSEFDKDIWGVVGEEISDLVPLERVGGRSPERSE